MDYFFTQNLFHFTTFSYITVIIQLVVGQVKFITHFFGLLHLINLFRFNLLHQKNLPSIAVFDVILSQNYPIKNTWKNIMNDHLPVQGVIPGNHWDLGISFALGVVRCVCKFFSLFGCSSIFIYHSSSYSLMTAMYRSMFNRDDHNVYAGPVLIIYIIKVLFAPELFKRNLLEGFELVCNQSSNLPWN